VDIFHIGVGKSTLKAPREQAQVRMPKKRKIFLEKFLELHEHRRDVDGTESAKKCPTMFFNN